LRHAFRRAAQYSDGWTIGGGTPDVFSDAVTNLRKAWSAAGRDDQPRTAALFYFALGDDAEEIAQQSLGHYYSFLGDYAQRIVRSAAKDADTLKGYVSAFEQAGADEVLCFPASSDPSQVEMLAEAVGL
jgi:alkanesulfonate monooxygenase SsuD/methylene tetrahydromethanopterin reductase-like flavin-dependent oxidoreductase (luciferase family)